MRGGYRAGRKDEVERDEHPRDRSDRDVQVAIDVGQREDNHRRVGKDQTHRSAERDA